MCRRSANPITRRRGGFSLVELVTTLVIIAVLGAVAVPRYANSLNRYRVDSAARRIAADFALAQGRARALSASVTLVFSTTLNQYQITGYADPDKPSTTYTVRLGDAPLLATLSAASFNGGASVTFNGYGVPGSAGSVTVRGGSSYQRTISIDADTGNATIQ